MTVATDLLARLPFSAVAGLAMPETAVRTVVSTGLPKLDAALKGGLAKGALHEVYAAEVADAPATIGLALGFAHRLAEARPIVWIRRDYIDAEVGEPYQPGIAGFGLDASALTFVRTHTAQETLQAGLDAARCGAIGVVLIDLWGETKGLDLAASRRLVLAARESGVTVLMASAASVPQPSAAETRWQVRAAPSRALPANAPGHPVFSITLLRQRSGMAGQEWYLEWKCDAGCFAERPGPGMGIRPAHEPPLSGGLVSVSGDRPVEGRDTDRFRRLG